ncbi:SWIM zinc finger family protein [Nocardioides terrigena]|uniref:SWIM zinc finger family protein n=1 Tax=Nocardioides terrigena TaxID=424797 RepID=UPI000D317BF4|nr:SWIM zinc finger family protein [Nocardioides terrigena]
MTGAHTVTHPRIPPRRGAGAGTWWSKAWGRAVEESAFGVAELRRGRALARAGEVGAIAVDTGSAIAAVKDGDDARTVTISVPPLDDRDAATFVELVGAESGRIAALLAGQLPHALVEACEEAGIELLPYGGELGSTCTCDSWLDPCPHALAVLTQVGWLLQEDPFVLLQLRGLSREAVLAGLHELTVGPGGGGVGGVGEGADPRTDDLAVAEDAALRAARMLSALEADPEVDLTRWW